MSGHERLMKRSLSRKRRIGGPPFIHIPFITQLNGLKDLGHGIISDVTAQKVQNAMDGTENIKRSMNGQKVILSLVFCRCLKQTYEEWQL